MTNVPYVPAPNGDIHTTFPCCGRKAILHIDGIREHKHARHCSRCKRVFTVHRSNYTDIRWEENADSGKVASL